MPAFSERSLLRLLTCDQPLITLFNCVIKRYDCAVICGYRGKEAQNAAFDAGMSKLQYPLSRHNSEPAMAVDVVPSPIDWKNIKEFEQFGYFVLGCAHGLGIRIRWGADWNNDLNTKNETFLDYAHFELL
jgi:peptidoglycan L-alanyl-D-glutamate endopeptidase CwlK